MDWSFYDRGFSLFPLLPKSKRPALEKWEPFQTERAHPDVIANWSGWADFNTGVATGAVSNCVVLDCDNLMARIEAESRGLPDTLTVSTPRGTHFYFQHPGWDVINRAGRAWTVGLDGVGVDGWDLRADGGYVVGPGSYFQPTSAEEAKGKVAGWYRIERDVPMAQAPDWLLALIMPKAHKPNAPAKVAEFTTDYGRAALNKEIAVLTSATSGNLNNQINLSGFAIGQLVAGGEITSEEGWGALWEAICALGVENDGKAPGTLERGFAAGMEVPRAVEHHEAVTPDQALGTRAPVAPPPPGPDGQVVAAAPPPPVRSFPHRGSTIWHEMMEPLFEGCWFVERQEAIFVRGRGLLKKTAFDTFFGGYQFPATIDNNGPKVKSAWEAFRTSPSWACPIVHDVCFRPDRPPNAPVEVEGREFINTFSPISTKRVKGDPAPFIRLLRKLFPVDRDFQIITTYLAALIQHPGRKFQWWPVLQGVKGNGKTMILNVIQHCIGQTYTHLVNPEAMGKTGNQFNSWVQGNLFVGVEEIFVADQRHILETFKPLVTNTRIAIESKGKDQTTGDNFANGIMLTNHKDGVPISDDERRYAIFWTAQQTVADLSRDGMDGAFFPDLWNWLKGEGDYADMGEHYGFSVVNDWLATIPLVAEFNPAGVCQRAPLTSSTKEAIKESLGTLEQEVLEAIEEHQAGFRGGWISSHAMRGLFSRLRVTIGPKRYRAIISALGYVPHPSLADGRVGSPLADGTRPRLYVAASSPLVGLGPSEAASAFESAQATAAPVPASNVVRLVPR